MARTTQIKAGVRTKIFRLFSSSIPSTVRFNARVADGGDVTGTVEVARWRWFNWQREAHPLGQQNAVDKGFADADFVIHVTPDQDCEITFERKSAGSAMIFILLAVAVVIVAAAVIMVLATAPASGAVVT